MSSKGILIQGGGGGVSSDELTATKDKVLQGSTYVGNDTDDEIGTGTIPIIGAVSQSLNCGGSYTIPEGYHDGKGKVTANSLASQTDGDASASHILKDKVAYVDGARIVGNIPSKAAATYYATTSDQSISASQYLSGAQTIKKLTQTNLSAANIKTGVTVKVNNGNADVYSVAGTFCSDATVTAANQVLSGYVAYGKNGTKYTGTVAVQSVISFSAAPYSSTQITFTWKNPAQGAFSGVIIVGKTGSTPTSISDGTRYYKGSGNNTSPSGTSTATVSGFSASTTYYFRAFAYAVKDNAEWVGGSLTANATTRPSGSQTFTSSGTFTVPANVVSIDIFCVGGGGGGGRKDYSESLDWYGSVGGGGGGRTSTKKAYAVTPGQTFAVTIGAGGTPNNSGGTTSFGSVLSATGGGNGIGSGYSGNSGGSGGSGGCGACSYVTSNESSYTEGPAGTDGSNGGTANLRYKNTKGTYYDVSSSGGSGQGTTTRAFGESSNTLYAGGGGGRTSTGGAGGGGNGTANSTGNAGTANTGGGGSGARSNGVAVGGSGGSGICIVRWG